MTCLTCLQAVHRLLWHFGCNKEMAMTAKILYLDKARSNKPEPNWTPNSTEKLNLSLSRLRHLMGELKEMVQQDEDLSSEGFGKKTKP